MLIQDTPGGFRLFSAVGAYLVTSPGYQQSRFTLTLL